MFPWSGAATFLILYSVLFANLSFCQKPDLPAVNDAAINIPNTVLILDKLKFKLLELAGDTLGSIWPNQAKPYESSLTGRKTKVDVPIGYKEPMSLQDIVNEEAKGRSGVKIISNPFAGIVPIPVTVPSDPLSGLMALEAEEFSSAINSGKSTEEAVCHCARNHLMMGEKRMTGRIVGGTSVTPNAMPWQIFVRILKQFRCGGTLLNKKFVLSAMHCYFKIVNLESPGKDILIGAGIHDLCIDPSKTEHGWQLAYVTRVHHQGNFNDRTFDNDIAILELDRHLTLNAKVLPACLPTRAYPPNTDVYISGWGQNTDDKVPCELQFLELPLHSQETCRNSDIGQRYLFTGAKPYPDIQICAGHLDGGKDACQGDSGGPLVTTGFHDYIEVVGIVSWGIGCGRKNSPGSYANVWKYIEFINKTIATGECWYKVDQNGTVKVLQRALLTAQANAEKIAENLTHISMEPINITENFSSTIPIQLATLSSSPFSTATFKPTLPNTLYTDQYLTTSPTSPALPKEENPTNQNVLQPTNQNVQKGNQGPGQGACKFSQWISNGFCDDLVNVPECDYDGGDCCNTKQPQWNIYCKKCECIKMRKVVGLPNGKTSVIPSFPRS